ncbi:hypothetical protein [Peptoniphilus obesi]|uniref:hypothetical protein n=1 Tax=Peptoniphilus obesi TaxID=1472765 RepID=UPI0004B42046|nr:hypothetical protein [Peptoniphilus obesi]
MNSSEKFNQELDDLLKRDYIDEDSEFFDELKLARDVKNLQNPNNKVEKEIYDNMKNKKSKKPLQIAAVAACLIIALPITTNAGQELYTRIKQAILPSGRVVVNEENQTLIHLKIKKFLMDIRDMSLIKTEKHLKK